MGSKKTTNQENTAVDEQDVELRPFPPFLPPQATVLMMGSFPPAAEKRAMAFHYPNFQNDMWRVYGLVFFGDAAHFQVPGEKAFDAERIKAFLTERGIGSCAARHPHARQRVRRLSEGRGDGGAARDSGADPTVSPHLHDGWQGDGDPL